MKVGEIISHIRELAPEEYAESWDNVGLQLGDENVETETVLLALTVTTDVIEEARRLQAGLIVCHHPLIFQPLSRITLEEPLARKIADLLGWGISLYVAHTNLDVAEGGVSSALADVLELQNVEPLIRISSPSRVKLVTFVPRENLEEVRQALCETGAGRIGRYACCTYQVSGEGTFLPLEGSNPRIGEVGRMEKVGEARLEILVERGGLERALEKLKEVHPYEEPAFDIYPLEGFRAGLGRMGKLPQPLSLRELAEHCRQRLEARSLRYLGDAGRRVTTVAVCGGSGEEVIEVAAGKVDALLTGDVKYHAALHALDLGLHIIDAGHAATEKVILPRLAGYLEERLAGKGVRICMAESDVDPWQMEG
jgi:dinuclear metal center YbgI/SA1388 family protein